MAEEVEGDDRAVRFFIDGIDRLLASIDPDEVCVSLCGLFLDSSCVWLVIFTRAQLVTFLVNNPGDLGLLSVCVADFVHAHGGGADEVCPPSVVAVTLDSEVFPLSQDWATTENDVLLGR